MAKETSMKRALMFLLVAPVLAAAAWFINVVANNGPLGFAATSAMILFIFAVFVAAIAALVDGCLARALPAYLRAALIATIGAAIPVGVILALAGCMLPQEIWMTFAIGGALCMGACSLLSNEYGRAKRLAMSTDG
jgi:hypothetical protein